MLKGFLFLLSLLVAYAYDEGRADSIMYLSAGNFSRAVSSNRMLLVDFYAPWCGYCKTLNKVLSQVASDLPNMNIEGRIAIVDASQSENEMLSLSERVDGYPSIILYREGERYGDYLGPRTRLDILEYLRKKLGPPATPVSTIDEVIDVIEIAKRESQILLEFNPAQMANPALSTAMGMDTPNLNFDGPLAVALALFIPTDPSSGVGLHGNICKMYMSLSSAYDQLVLLYADNLELIDHFDIQEDSLLIFTTDDTPTGIISLVDNPDKPITEEGLITSILSHTLPTYVPYSTQTQPFINSLPIKQHVLIFHDLNERSQRVLAMMEPIADMYKGELIFITVNNFEHHLFQFFGVESTSVPELIIVDMENEFNMKRFVFMEFLRTTSSTFGEAATQGAEKGKEEEAEKRGRSPLEGIVAPDGTTFRPKEDPISEQTVRKFLDFFLEGQLTRSLFSEDYDTVANANTDGATTTEEASKADDNRLTVEQSKGLSGTAIKTGNSQSNQLIKSIVSLNFHEEVISASHFKDVFVYIYAPWCAHCKSFEPVMEDAAKVFASDKGIEFVRIDGSRNEIDHDDVDVKGYPSFYLFPMGDAPVEYDGDRTVNAIASFLSKYRKRSVMSHTH